MTRYIVAIILVLSVLSGACTARRNQVVRKNRIPEKDLVPILTEMYTGDGLLSLPEISYRFADKDSVSTYIDILEKYGYTKEIMDRTMRYYFIKKPNKLVKIYDRVLGTLSAMESRIDREIPIFEKQVLNLWKGQSAIYFPDNNYNDTSAINIPLNYLMTYYLKFTLTIYPDDQTPDPRPGIYYTFPDSSAGNIHYLTSFPYLKDGRPHNYNFQLRLNKPVPVILKGWFINTENLNPGARKHYTIENIIFSRGQI
jgi:hypothetical protein